MKRTARCVSMVGALMLAVAACGGDDDDDAGSDSDAAAGELDDAASTDEAPATSLSPEDEVLEAYRAAREAIFAAYDPPDPTDPDMVALVDGEALGALQNELGQAQADGISYTGPFELNPQVITLGSEEAVVEDCLSEHTQEVNTQTSETLGPPFDSVHHNRVDLQRIDGVWKIVRIQELSESCTP